MVNQDILGGLKSALSRGYSLDEAMLSFLNAGYKQREIEEASQSLQAQVSPAELLPQPIWPPKPSVPAKQAKPEPVVQPRQVPAPPPKQVVTKGVAAYVNVKELRAKTITIILIVLLVILLGILGLMYVFRSQIIDFFNSLL